MSGHRRDSNQSDCLSHVKIDEGSLFEFDPLSGSYIHGSFFAQPLCHMRIPLRPISSQQGQRDSNGPHAEPQENESDSPFVNVDKADDKSRKQTSGAET